MSVTELQELDEVKGLLAKGQQLGVLSYTEIAKAMSDVDLDESDVEELHGFLERAEIELVEDIDPATAASTQVERAPDRRGRRKAKTALDLKPDMTTDSLQLFLKDIGKVRLLTAAGGGRTRQAHRARRPRRQAEDGRVRTCAWSFRSPRTTATRACRSST